jgi:lipopolysaccharide export system protein LptA
MRFSVVLGLLISLVLLISLGVSQDAQQQTPAQPSPAQNQTTEATPEATPSTDEATTSEAEPAQRLNLPKLTIKRKERTIVVSQTASSAEGGRQPLNAKGCDDKDKDLIYNTFFAPDPYFIETQVNDALLTSRIALSKQPPNKRNEAGDVIERGGDKSVLELFGGSLEFPDERSGCPKNIERAEQAEVTLKEGRTTVKGVTFRYLNETGIGTMKGPITLDRVAEGDSPALNATSESLETNVDEDKTYLTGNVKVTSEDRVSEAATLEYNEESGLAILRGNEETPAKSTKGSDVLQGDVIIYYLDTNDVVVQGSLQGDIEVDLEDEPSADSSDDTPDEPVTDTNDTE